MKTVKLIMVLAILAGMSYACTSGGSSRRGGRFGAKEVDIDKIKIGMTKAEVEDAVGKSRNYSIMMGSGSMSYENVLITIEGDTVNAVKSK